MTTTPIVSITDELIAELEAAANAATPGPWGWDGPVWNYDPEEEAPWLVQEGGEHTVITGELSCSEQNAEFLALANPATIIALLAERAELKRDAERYRWLRDYLRHDYKRWESAGSWNHSNIPAAEFDAAIDAAMQEAKP